MAENRHRSCRDLSQQFVRELIMVVPSHHLSKVNLAKGRYLMCHKIE